MKHKNVYRGLSSMPSAQQQSNVPVMGIGRVSRIHRTYQRQRKRSRSRHRNKGQFLMRYLRLILLIGTLAFVSSVTWMLYQQVNETKNLVVQNTSAEQETPPPSLTAKQSVEIVNQWLQSKSPAEMAKTTRLAGLTQTQAFEKLQDLLALHGSIKKIKWLGTDQSYSIATEKVLVSFESGKFRVATLLLNDQNAWQIDLASFVAMSSKPWEEIIKTKTCDVLVRVMICSDSYYNGEFLDEQIWACYALSHPDSNELLYGYVKKSSETYEILQENMGLNPSIPVTLEITRDESMLKSQCKIKKFVTRGWLILDKTHGP